MRLLLAALILLAYAAPASAQWRTAPDLDLGDEARPLAVDVGDFDSDGKQDLAISDVAGNIVHVRLGNGDGTFRGSGGVADNVKVEDAAVADLNADGDEDLVIVVPRDDAGSLRGAPGAGDGSFVLHSSKAIPGKPTALP